jgi:hypothetical protein
MKAALGTFANKKKKAPITGAISFALSFHFLSIYYVNRHNNEIVSITFRRYKYGTKSFARGHGRTNQP